MCTLLTRCLLLVSLLTSGLLGAQDYLDASYLSPAGRPQQLNVCGDSDRATYELVLRPGSPDLRNVLVTVTLFEGVYATGFDAANSSVGASLVSLADPTRPVVSVPDLAESGGPTRVHFALELAAGCRVADTLAANPAAEVRDVLDVSYVYGGGSSNTERETIDEYRAAVTLPAFSLAESLSRSPVRVGQTLTRTLEIANGSFRGYADTLRYLLVQGPGLSVQTLRVNGAQRAFAKTTNAAGDTLINLRLSGADFGGNLSATGAGNGDTRFDPDERLLIEQTLYVSECRNSRLAEHSVAYGCDGGTCASSALDTDLPVGIGQPLVSITRAPGAFPNSEVGYCQRGDYTLRVENTGSEADPGFGTAFDLALGNVIDGSLTAGGYRISALEIAGVAITDLRGTLRLDTLAAFATDPDAAGSGLEDLDGDGFFDDLAVGESLAVTVAFELVCEDIGDYDASEHCANDALATFQAQAYWTDPCARTQTAGDGNLYAPRNILDDFEQRTPPDADAEGAPFRVELEFERLVFDFANGCSADAEMLVYVKLPTGVTVDGPTSSLDRGGAASMPLLGLTQQNDTATLRFDPSGEAFLNGRYTLGLSLSADCSAPLGELMFPTTVAYYCPTCDCEHLWICEELSGPYLHRNSPPCNIADLYPCPGGVQGTSFSIERTSFGFSDGSYATRLDAGTANEKAALPADSVEIRIDGLVGDFTLTDSLGIVLHYLTPNDEVDTAGLFLLGEATLEWFDGTTWRSCGVGPTAHTLETSGTTTRQRFDLGGCLTANGWAVDPSDSIRFTGQFEINPLGPITTSYEFVEDLRGGFYAVSDGLEVQCDQYGDVFRVGSPFTVFGVPSNGDFPRGCAPATLDFRLTGVNRGYATEFGPEFRRAARLDSLVVEFDTSLFDGFEVGAVELRVANHPTQGSSYFPVRPLSDFPDGRYVLVLDTLTQTADLHVNYPELYSLRLNLRPTCGSIRSSSNADANYAFNARPHYRDRYYATDIGSGARVEPETRDVSFAMRYSEPVALDMQLLSVNPHATTTDEAEIELIICNTSSDSEAGRTWLTFDDTSAVTVVSAELADDPGAPVPLTLNPYGGGHFVHLEGVRQNQTSNTTAEICNAVRVVVNTAACGVNPLRLATGWACGATVPTGWTPADDAACTDDRVLAQIETVAPFLETTLTQEPTGPRNLCDPITLQFQVNNAQGGTAFDVLNQLYVPDGLTYVPNSARIAYPASGPPQATVSEPTASPAEVRGNGLRFADLAALHPALGTDGLLGFRPNGAVDSNRYLLELQFTSDCNYRSGSLVYFEAQGQQACGNQTNFAGTETSAIEIAGATPDPAHEYEVAFVGDPRLDPGPVASTLEVRALNTGTAPTDANDVVAVTLPAGLTYLAGSSDGLEPAGYVPGEPTVASAGGVNELTWPLPAGMNPGERARLGFEVRSDAAACGESVTLGLAATRFQSTTCTASGSTCDLPSDATRGGAKLVDFTVGRSLVATVVEARATCESDTTELVELEVRLDAMHDFSGTPADLRLYRDRDGDRLAGPGDDLLDQRPVPVGAGDSSVTYRFSGSLPSAALDELLLFADSAALDLCAHEHVPLPVPQLDNAANQPSFGLCVSDENELQLGFPACARPGGYTYGWTSLPAGFDAYLDNASSAAPLLTLPRPYTGPDTLRYVLHTDRAGGGDSYDTVLLAISPGVALTPTADERIDYGDQIVISPDVSTGRNPLRYLWSPATSLSSASEATPIASPDATTTYSVTVSDAFGCSASATQLVEVRNPVDASVDPSDTTVCSNDRLTLTASGGTRVRWVASATNPSDSVLSDTSGLSVSFFARNAVGTYRFRAIVSDVAYPGFFDTVEVRVVSDASRCAPPIVWRDTVVLGSSSELCLSPPQVGLNAASMTVADLCPSASGSAVTFGTDDARDCVGYRAVDIGEETACLQFCDSTGRCTEGTLIVTVIAGSKVVIRDRLYINETHAYCVDSADFDRLRFYAAADRLLERAWDTDSPCLSYRGLELGSDTLAVEVERLDGTLDSVCFIVDVVEYLGGSVARADSVCTVRNTPIQINVLANDEVFGGVTSFRVSEPPVEGTLVVNPDNTLTYTPAPDVCARDIRFGYEVCNPNEDGCATAQVTVCVTCEELTVFTAISPNRDGVNDVFYVAKIEEFPNNHLQVYNRWGTIVYETRGYRNDWAGTYQGDPLPDAAYFYILTVTDAGETDTYRGYVEISR